MFGSAGVNVYYRGTVYYRPTHGVANRVQPLAWPGFVTRVNQTDPQGRRVAM